MFELTVSADGHAPRLVRAELKRWMATRGWPTEEAGDVLLAVSEAVSNSSEHAYAEQADAPGSVSVAVTELTGIHGRRVEAVVSDSGAWRAGPSLQPRGRGLYMMKLLTASCEVERDLPGTRVTMISKSIPEARVTSAAAGMDEGDIQDEGFEERLRWLEIVTDTGLANLSVDRLLNELIDRVRALMDVDTAAVLLLDPSRQFLIARVARGLEEEVHQGVRIPLGRGFAGRIAKERRWVSILHVDHDNVLNPILREKGVVSLLGVPLIAGGMVMGVLHVGTLTSRQFSEHDAELLQIVADRAAMATQSRISEAERTAASTMQRHLLPAKLPEVAGFEFASRYVAGGEGNVGGDWYDVFPLPSGSVCVVVGDAVGHGLEAAQSMSQIRAVLRSHALHTDDPADLLARVDEHVKHFQPGTIATALCGMLEPGADLLRISSAGHPPPILAGPSGEAIAVRIKPGLPLGVELGHSRPAIDIPLAPGSVLCLYSDGLVERRHVLVDDNIEILRTVVNPQPAESVCVEVMRRLVGPLNPEDDVAVLVVRRLPLDQG